jgi:hypothetical protein
MYLAEETRSYVLALGMQGSLGLLGRVLQVVGRYPEGIETSTALQMVQRGLRSRQENIVVAALDAMAAIGAAAESMSGLALDSAAVLSPQSQHHLLSALEYASAANASVESCLRQAWTKAAHLPDRAILLEQLVEFLELRRSRGHDVSGLAREFAGTKGIERAMLARLRALW